MYVPVCLYKSTLSDLRRRVVLVFRFTRGSRNKDCGKRLFSLVSRNHFSEWILTVSFICST